MEIEYKCPICNGLTYLKFLKSLHLAPAYYYVCNNSHLGKHYYQVNELIKNNKFLKFIDTNKKGFAEEINSIMKSLSENEKEEFEFCLKIKMYDILVHYVICRLPGCYSRIYKYILIDYLKDVDVLSEFLKSRFIKTYGRKPIQISNNGEKIYYDLFYDFMLVNNQDISDHLSHNFPKYLSDFYAGVLPSEQYNFIDYQKNIVIRGD